MRLLALQGLNLYAAFPLLFCKETVYTTRIHDLLKPTNAVNTKYLNMNLCINALILSKLMHAKKVSRRSTSLSCVI